jgi:SAM-dependent methyltransferase
MASAAEAFSAEAARYDEGFGRNPVGLLFRSIVQERLRRLFPRGTRVLDLGCGTGDDALALAAAGLHVDALDPAAAMVARARAKAAGLGIGEDRCRFHHLASEDVAALGSGFGGAYSDFGALNCADLGRVGRSLAAVLDPGAPVLLSLLGHRPLPASLRRWLTGVGEARGARPPVVGGVPIGVAYPAPAEARRALGPGFEWRRTWALGVLVPPPEAGDWAGAHPQSFGLLAALEAVAGGWPVLRDLGDHVVMEGVRR